MNHQKRITSHSIVAGVARSAWTGVARAIAAGLVILATLFGNTGMAWAQDATLPLTVRHDTLQVTGKGPFLLRPWIVEGTLYLSWEVGTVPTDSYEVDWARGLISFHDGPANDSTWMLYAQYHHIPLPAAAERSAWARADADEDGGRPGPASAGQQPLRPLAPAPSRSALVQSGSITRGVVAGSGRDASVESALRFELTGEIAPGVQVSASLTDEDTPILPQGTTRRLDQLDRVFIRIASAQGVVEMGDVEVNLARGRYGRVRRNLQGVTLNTGLRQDGLTVGLIGAVSRGRFRFQQVETLDGVQGPYRLRGDQGEPFILVVPGSERVFLNGAVLIRGELEDYTIDYHTAEITFTARHLIGRESRIRVEFEYTTNQFTRTFVSSDAGIRMGSGGRWGTAGITYIREADGSAFTRELAFTAQDSLTVIEAGDEPALRSGARHVTYNPQAPYTQYILMTAPDGKNVFRAIDTVPDSDTDVFRVIFSNVGSGSGAYRRTGLAVNGVVFEYVGVGLGDYNPVVPLSAPSAHDLVTMRGSLTRIPGLRLSGEVASSRLDLNTLSPLDEADNTGLAWLVDLQSERRHVRSVWTEFRAESSRRSANFASFARTRDVDFAYKWNLEPTDLVGNARQGTAEHMSMAELSVGVMDSTGLHIGLDRLDLGSVFSGSSVFAVAESYEPGGPEVRLSAERTYTNKRDQGNDGTWSRFSGRVAAPSAWPVRPFGAWQSEQLASGSKRTALSAAPDFRQYQSGVRAGRGQWSGSIATTFRDEVRWVTGADLSGTDTRIWMLQTGLAFEGTRSQWVFDLGGRRTRIEGADADNSLLLSLTQTTRLADRTRLYASYNARSEQSAVLQEIYIRSGPERGEFVWDDFNGDGIIQLDEFLPETNPSEGDYVRALLPGDSLEASTTVQARVRLDREVTNANGLRGIGLSSTVEVLESNRSKNRRAIYTLRPSALQTPGETIQGRFRIAQQVTLFPAAHRYGVEFMGQLAQSMSGRSTGTESGKASTLQTTLRYRPARHMEWGLQWARDIEESESSAFASRSYDIRSHRAEPSLRYRWPGGWSLHTAPSLAWKTERRTSSAARVFRFPVDAVREFGLRARATFRLEHARNDVDEKRTGLVVWELTEGRGSGNSWLWRVGLQAELNDSLTARIGYDGRSPSSGKTIHTGRFQLTAFF